jgi:hypothetical protein
MANPLMQFDNRVRGDAADRLVELAASRRSAADQAVADRVKRYGERDNESLAPEIARLHQQLSGQQKAPAGASEAQLILSQIAQGLGPSGQGVKNIDVANALLGAESMTAEKAAVLQYLAQKQGPGLEARGYDALIGINQALADQGLKGKMSRAGLYSGIGAGATMGTTAGAQQILALIDYLQGGGQETEMV